MTNTMKIQTDSKVITSATLEITFHVNVFKSGYNAIYHRGDMVFEAKFHETERDALEAVMLEFAKWKNANSDS